MRPACGRNVRGSSAYEPHLDSMAVEGRREVERLAARDAELPLHEVDARDRLGHRVLDLDAAVQLEKVELAAVDDELRGAGRAIADLPREAHGCVAHLRAQVGVECG